MISPYSDPSEIVVAFPGADHLKKANALLRMAGFAEDVESRLTIQRMAEVHMAAAQAARTVSQ